MGFAVPSPIFLNGYSLRSVNILVNAFAASLPIWYLEHEQCCIEQLVEVRLLPKPCGHNTGKTAPNALAPAKDTHEQCRQSRGDG